MVELSNPKAQSYDKNPFEQTLDDTHLDKISYIFFLIVFILLYIFPFTYCSFFYIHLFE